MRLRRDLAASNLIVESVAKLTEERFQAEVPSLDYNALLRNLLRENQRFVSEIVQDHFKHFWVGVNEISSVHNPSRRKCVGVVKHLGQDTGGLRLEGHSGCGEESPTNI